MGEFCVPIKTYHWLYRGQTKCTLGRECGMWWPVGRPADAGEKTRNSREDTETPERTSTRGKEGRSKGCRMRPIKASEKPYLTLRWCRPSVLCKGRTLGESSQDPAQSIMIANLTPAWTESGIVTRPIKGEGDLKSRPRELLGEGRMQDVPVRDPRCFCGCER